SWFWGLTLNLQSVVTPDVNYFVWIPLEFAQYWIAHGAGVLAPVVLVWGLGYRPTLRGCGLAYAATVLWAAIAFTGNALTGANYGYLNRAPAGPSILDLLGPWPQYLLVEAVLIAVVWTPMTVPWVLLDRRAGTPPSGRGGLARPSVPAQASSSSSARRRGPWEVAPPRRACGHGRGAPARRGPAARAGACQGRRARGGATDQGALRAAPGRGARAGAGLPPPRDPLLAARLEPRPLRRLVGAPEPPGNRLAAGAGRG